MIKYVILIICTVTGGILGGMGMGGGTLTIPLLTIFCLMTQHEAQAVNLVAFIPMAAATLVIHTKNKLVEYKKVLPIAIPALITSVLCSFAALKVKGKTLALCYGIFLVLLGIYQLTALAVRMIKKKKADKKQKENSLSPQNNKPI